jgi:hypothetical protein
MLSNATPVPRKIAPPGHDANDKHNTRKAAKSSRRNLTIIPLQDNSTAGPD